MATIHRCDLCHRDITITGEKPEGIVISLYTYFEHVLLCDTCAKPIYDLLRRHQIIHD